MNVREKTTKLLDILFANKEEVEFSVTENGQEQTGKIKIGLDVSLRPLTQEDLGFKVKVNVGEGHTTIHY